MNIQRIDGPFVRHDQEADSPGSVGYYWIPPRKVIIEELEADYLRQHGLQIGVENQLRRVTQQMSDEKLRQAWLSNKPPYIPEPAPPPRA